MLRAEGSTQNFRFHRQANGSFMTRSNDIVNSGRYTFPTSSLGAKEGEKPFYTVNVFFDETTAGSIKVNSLTPKPGFICTPTAHNVWFFRHVLNNRSPGTSTLATVSNPEL